MVDPLGAVAGWGDGASTALVAFAAIIVFGSIIMGVLFWALNESRFKTRVVVFQFLNGNIIQLRDRAAIVKDRQSKDGKELRLYRKKRNIPLPQDSDFILTSKGKKCLYFSLSNDEYQPMQVAMGKKGPELDFISRDLRQFHLNKNREILTRKAARSFWHEYGGVIVVVGAGLMMGVILLIIVQEVKEATEIMSRAAIALADAFPAGSA